MAGPFLEPSSRHTQRNSISSMDLSAIERAKIDCVEKLFNSISTANVKYHKVATYQDLIDGMNAIS